MSELFSIQLQNRQQQGRDGIWLDLPTTTEQVQAALRQIGISSDNPHGLFISGYFAEEEKRFAIPYNMVLASNVDELNFLASRLETLSTGERAELNAALQVPHTLFGKAKYPPCRLTKRVSVKNLFCNGYCFFGFIPHHLCAKGFGNEPQGQIGSAVFHECRGIQLHSRAIDIRRICANGNENDICALLNGDALQLAVPCYGSAKAFRHNTNRKHGPKLIAMITYNQLKLKRGIFILGLLLLLVSLIFFLSNV